MTSRLAALVALLLGLLVLPIPAAEATVIWSPTLEITGEPTAEEAADIRQMWSWINEAFPSTKTCMQPVTVHVVDRVEEVTTAQLVGVMLGQLSA